jgi:hypothetical protein
VRLDGHQKLTLPAVEKGKLRQVAFQDQFGFAVAVPALSASRSQCRASTLIAAGR